MKKVIYSLCLFVAIGLASCGGSVDSKIDKVAQLTKESQEIRSQMANGDDSNSKKLDKITAELGKLSAELNNADLTEEQKERLTKAALGM